MRLSALAAPALVAGAAVCGCAAVAAADPTVPGGPIPVCPTKALLGVVCPGCGAMRMIASLVHGDIGAAVHFNALAVIAIPLLLWSYLAWTAARAGRPRWPRWEHWRWSPHVMAVAVLAWTVVRNLPFEPFTGLRV